jgi:hypothetical protein
MAYAQLKTDIANWLDREDDDIEQTIVRSIAFAEAEFRRELSKQEAVSTNTTDGARLALPNDFGEMRALTVTTNGYAVPLEFMGLPAFQDDLVGAEPDFPRFYAVHGKELLFAPVPDQDYDLTLNYRRGFTALSDANPTNWLLDDHPDLYLNGGLWLASVHFKHWEAAAYYKAETGCIMGGIERDLVRKAMGGAPIAPRGPVRNIPGVLA